MFGGRRSRVACAAGLLLVTACGNDDDGDAAAAGCVQLAVTQNDAEFPVGSAQVALVRDDGETRLVTGEWVATEPSLSPDGTQMVVVRADGDYESAGPESTSLWVIGTGTADGDAPEGRGVTEGPWDDTPAWSPDGSEIAFTRQDGSDFAVLVVPAAGGDPRTLIDQPGTQALRPTWSPDSDRLAVVALGPDGNPRHAGTIWTVAADGSELREVATVGGAHTLDWHPDGDTLMVSTFAGEDGDVRLVNVGTGEVTEVAEHATMATWAPDGEGVYYFADNGDVPGEQWRLAFGRIDGGRLEPERFVGDLTDYLYPYFGTDTGPCPSGG